MNAGKGSSVGTVWFVGAGPGDPDLITVKGRRLLEQAGAILFAGSLVDQTATHHAPSGCEIRDSKDMTLEQMSVWLLDACARHLTVVRLQTGDPGLYGGGATRIRCLKVPESIVPGPSATP